ncbi:MAG: TetR family transcriptional regulator C-terminal domain-containing protein [Deltaproteobacteria bacterium]|nr:TetR family transcriptional regulator C-terminal domain-containing protein [Deltaproteobacteria bacterium]
MDFERIAEELVALVDGIAIKAMFEPDRFPRSRQLAIVDRLLQSISAKPSRENPALA